MKSLRFQRFTWRHGAALKVCALFFALCFMLAGVASFSGWIEFSSPVDIYLIGGAAFFSMVASSSGREAAVRKQDQLLEPDRIIATAIAKAHAANSRSRSHWGGLLGQSARKVAESGGAASLVYDAEAADDAFWNIVMLVSLPAVVLAGIGFYRLSTLFAA